MRAFADLYAALDATSRSNERVAALAAYLASAPGPDRVWAVALLSGRRPRRAVSTTDLRRWAAARAGLPEWLFEDAYAAVGDLAETIALVLPDRPDHPPNDGPPDGCSPAALRPETSPALAATRPPETARPETGLPDGCPPGTGTTLVPPPSSPSPADPTPPDTGLAGWMARIGALAAATPEDRRGAIEAAWDGLSPRERLVFNKLVTGGFRVGVGPGLIQRALAQVTGLEPAIVAHRLMGDWDPATTPFDALVSGDDPAAALARPYPFALAHPLEAGPETLGSRDGWIAEWKWDGIRGQIVRRSGAVHLWSRGEELVTAAFPEVAAAAQALPDGTVLDGELLAWAGTGNGIGPETGPETGPVNGPGICVGPMPFASLQRRLGRKAPAQRLLAEAPVVFLAWDLLEAGGRDLRPLPLEERRKRLTALLGAPGVLRLSEEVAATDWAALAALRESAGDRGAEGLMLKQRDAPYPVGRPRGPWWKWKRDPRSVDAVMVYAQAGHGRRAGLYTDYTFALWQDGALVPVAKAYSGLTDAEFREITAWVRRHTLERFGPVRRVVPELVFEIAFEGVQPSPRHKAGLALRFPRMLRWRRDKPAAEADRLETLRAMIPTISTEAPPSRPPEEEGAP